MNRFPYIVACIMSLGTAAVFEWSSWAWRNRCLKERAQANYERSLANIRYDLLKSNCDIALGFKPQPGTWTMVRTVEGYMRIRFTGEEFVEDYRWTP